MHGLTCCSTALNLEASHFNSHATPRHATLGHTSADAHNYRGTGHIQRQAAAAHARILPLTTPAAARCSAAVPAVAAAAVAQLHVDSTGQRAVRSSAVPLPLPQLPGLQRAALPRAHGGEQQQGASSTLGRSRSTGGAQMLNLPAFAACCAACLAAALAGYTSWLPLNTGYTVMQGTAV
jgi:hypothetical protein